MRFFGCHRVSVSFLAALTLSVLFLFGAATPASAGEFQAPVPITSADGPPVEDWSTDVDHFRNIVIALVQDGNLSVDTITGGRLRNVTNLASTGTAKSPADIALTPLRTSIAYTDNSDDNGKPEIFLVDRVGSRMGPPRNISANALIDS